MKHSFSFFSAVLLSIAASIPAYSQAVYTFGDVSPSHGVSTPTWDIEEALTIGGQNNGYLFINEGGTASSSSTLLGDAASSEGGMYIMGTGAAFNTGELIVGDEGEGIVSITGGSLESTSSYIAGQGGSIGSVNVDGATSTWKTEQLEIGREGNGTLDILNGGSVNTVGIAVIASFPTSVSSVKVSGANSSWKISQALHVGMFSGGNGELLISDGGTVTVQAFTHVHTDDRITIETGGTLQSVGGTIISSGGMIGGDGTLEGDLTLEAGALWSFDLASTLTITGTVSLDSSFSIASLQGLDNLIAPGTYTLIDGTSTDFSTLNLQNWGIANAYNLGNGLSAYFSQGSLTITVIPEPGSVLLLAFSVTFTLCVRRKSGFCSYA